MIKAEELRLGNWVTYPNSKPFQISRENFMDHNFWENLADNIEPVPLTPEILEKCGFEFREDNYMFKDLNNARIGLGFYGGAYDKMTLFQFQGLPFNEAKEFKMHFGANHPNCLHQVQNLYFSLTGEELIFKTEQKVI